MAGRIQNQDIKTETELVAGGANKASLPNDNKVYIASIGKRLDESLRDFDISIGDSPLRLFASLTPDSLLNIKANVVKIADGTSKSSAPIGDNIGIFPATTVNFASGAISGGTVTSSGDAFSLPATTIGRFRRLVFSLQSSGSIDSKFSDAAVSVATLSNPGLLFSAIEGTPIGYIDLEAYGSNTFKTAGSVTNIIENQVSGTSRIFVFGGGAGGSGGSTLNVIAGENITVSTNPVPVYISPGSAAGDTGRTAGQFYQVDAGNASVPLAAIRSRGVGFISSSATSGAPGNIQYRGTLSGFTGLNPSYILYADPSVIGGITETIPITISKWVVPLGQAVSSTKLKVNSSSTEDAYLIQAANISAWPSIFVSSEAQLAAAFTSLIGVGGVICLLTSFSITSSYTIPSNVILVGRGFGTTLTLAGSGNTLTLSSGSEIRDLKLVPTYSSGTMVSLPNNFCVLDKCWFLVDPVSTVVCVDVTGNSNRLFVNRFDGVSGGPAVGVQYTSGSDNSDTWSIFL